LRRRASVGFLCAVRRVRNFFKYWLPVLLWLALIFGASADSGSSKRSSRIIEPLVRWLFPQVSEPVVSDVVFYVRKCAHVTEYAILALLLWRALRKPGPDDRRPWSRWQVALVLGLTALYATSDELHQSFVPSRQGTFHDVLIDTTGAALGLFVWWWVTRWWQRRKDAQREGRRKMENGG
jgi:VanZ family protein